VSFFVLFLYSPPKKNNTFQTVNKTKMADQDLLAPLRPDGKAPPSELADEGGLFFNTGFTVVSKDRPDLTTKSSEQNNSTEKHAEDHNLFSPRSSSGDEEKKTEQKEHLAKNGSGFFNPAMEVYRDFIVVLNRVIFEQFANNLLIKAREIKKNNSKQSSEHNEQKFDVLSSFRAANSFHFADAFAGVGPLAIRVSDSLKKAQENFEQRERAQIFEETGSTGTNNGGYNDDPNYLEEEKANLLGYTVSANDMSTNNTIFS